MIPRIAKPTLTDPHYLRFMEALAKTSFSGDIQSDFASRLVASTDNSIYQIVPQGVLFPKTEQDIQACFVLAKEPQFRGYITFSPRGGGTGTNGQSLSPGLILDLSTYFTRIVEFNEQGEWIRVEAGVTLDQVNRFLKPKGYFFAPHVSCGNRATIGGMINTDACGKGSRVYGRTSQHLTSLSCVLEDGSAVELTAISSDTLNTYHSQTTRLGAIYRTVNENILQHKERIHNPFPKLTRYFTGYNLTHIQPHTDIVSLIPLIAGSEGTLAIVYEAKLKVTRLPSHKTLVAIQYSDFLKALEHAPSLLNYNPTAIENMDETVLHFSSSDEEYHAVQCYFNQNTSLTALNLVEFTAYSETEMMKQVNALRNDLQNSSYSFYITTNESEMNKAWTLRKKGVELLSRMQGKRKPVPFIEDTAVPIENLVAYIRDFKSLLDTHGLTYGMFGHPDAGCIHVRPALDLKNPLDEKLIKSLSDNVARLLKKYGGVIWGEHGKGFRSDYIPEFVGMDMARIFGHIKAAFDPDNILNPGKIAVPNTKNEKLFPLNSPLRAHRDRQISPTLQDTFSPVIECNGNGVCFNVNPGALMCPSYQATRNRIHSPKGRAMLIKEWLRHIGKGSKASFFPKTVFDFFIRFWNTFLKQKGKYDFSHEVYDALHGCLNCKACATQCPIQVDIPEFKSLFLQDYHSRYLRPIRDYFVAYLEESLSIQSGFSSLSHWLLQLPLLSKGFNRIGLADIPTVSHFSLKTKFQHRNSSVLPKKFKELSDLKETLKEKSTVLLLQDAFTTFYEPDLVLDTLDALQNLGFSVRVLPFLKNGKPAHVKGFLKKFQKTAENQWDYFNSLSQWNIPIVGIEPSIVLTYRDDYPKILKKPFPVHIHLLQEWLASRISLIQDIKAETHRFISPDSHSGYHTLSHIQPRTSNHGPIRPAPTYYLFSHCTEKALVPKTGLFWKTIFEAAGLSLEVIETGCCGMAGIYGHEAEHKDYSKHLFDSWKDILQSHNIPKEAILATGYSCRSQCKRFMSVMPLHPIQVLKRRLSQKEFNHMGFTNKCL